MTTRCPMRGPAGFRAQDRSPVVAGKCDTPENPVRTPGTSMAADHRTGNTVFSYRTRRTRRFPHDAPPPGQQNIHPAVPAPLPRAAGIAPDHPQSSGRPPGADSAAAQHSPAAPPARHSRPRIRHTPEWSAPHSFRPFTKAAFPAPRKAADDCCKNHHHPW